MIKVSLWSHSTPLKILSTTDNKIINQHKTLMFAKSKIAPRYFEKVERINDLKYNAGQRFFLKNDFIKVAHSCPKIPDVTLVLGCNKFAEIVE